MYPKMWPHVNPTENAMKGASSAESCINLLIVKGIPPTVTASRSYIPRKMTDPVSNFAVNDITTSQLINHYEFYLLARSVRFC